MSTDTPTARREKPSFSIPSIIALIATALIFFTDGFDFILAIVGVIAGLIGGALALLPGVRGGIVSILSIVIGLASAVISIFQLIF